MSIYSFKRGFIRPGPRFRTPSPPRDAYEPLTPPPQLPDLIGAGTQDGHKEHLALPTLALDSAATGGGRQVFRQPSPIRRHGSADAKSQTPASPIDALANAASSLSASPAFGSLSLQPPHKREREPPSRERSPRDAHTSSATLGGAPANFEERPSKRARSEFLPSPELPPRASRPNTSHNPSHQWSYQVEEAVESDTLHEDIRSPPIEHRRHPSQADLEIAESLLNLFNSTPRLSTQHADHSTQPVSLSTEPVTGRSLQASASGPIYHSAVQTHTPPEEALPSAASTEQRDLSADKKARDAEGLRPPAKGKSTRRRSSASTATKRTNPTKRGKGKEAPGYTHQAPEQLHSPQSLGVDVSTDQSSNDTDSGTARDTLMVEAKFEATTKPRRLSASNANSLIVSGDSSDNRAASVPLHTSMVIQDAATQTSDKVAVEVRPVQAASGQEPEEQADPVTVCAGCHFASTWSGETNHWISCDGCAQWFHFACAGFKNEREVRSVDKFFCRACRPTHGPTTYVRKSKRTHAAVDYAGLNEGVIRTPEDSHEHHYIRRIKEGGIEFLPERFPRIRPELLTVDFLEKGSFTEPIVIPASLNPRPGDADTPMPDSITETQEHHGQEDMMEDLEYEYVPDDGQDRLDMVIPKGLNVRRVAELYGPEQPVEVIEVKSQEGSDKRWNMERWADYYEEEGDKVIRNVISLEISTSKLGRLIRRPKVVRDIDLQDSVWPKEEYDKGLWPKVQFYCLMSVADCYTDFHIDFGGSSVFYHIIKGNKTFFFIPPTQKNLKQYEEWCLSPAQNWTFLGDHTKDCYRIDLSEGDTMLIPSGWIHAVWTPTNSLVIGGNFLTRMHYDMQIKVAEIEKNTKVARRFRYPHFQKVLWYTVLKYLEEDPLPQGVAQLFYERKQFPREVPIYLEPNNFGHNSKLGPENYNARYYSKAELDGLPALVKYIWRTVRISLGAENNVTMEVRNAVSKSIPKGRGDPLEIAKTFAAWVAWKRGNENLPEWAHSDASLTVVGEQKEKKTAEKPRPMPTRQMPDRKGVSSPPMAARPETPKENSTGLPVNSYVSPSLYTAASLAGKHLSTPKTSQLGPKRIACDACRKRRIRCKHKDDVVTSSNFAAQRFGSGGVQPFQEGSGTAVALRTLAGQAVGQLGQLPNGNSTTTVPGQGNTAYPDVMMDSRLILDASHFESGDNKKGRNKACVDCRRSKRRCIHDENGAIDPIKAQEAKIPRGSHKKRRVSGEETSPTIKRPKKESLSGNELGNDVSMEASNEHADSMLAEDGQENGLPLPDGLSEIAMAALGADDAEHYEEADQEMADISPFDPALEAIPHQDVAVSSIEDHQYHQPAPRADERPATPPAEAGGSRQQSNHSVALQAVTAVNGYVEPPIPPSSPLTDLATSPARQSGATSIKREPGSGKGIRHSSRASKAPERFTPEHEHATVQTPRPVSRGKSHDTVSSSKKKTLSATPKQEKKTPRSKEELEEEASRKLARELQELEFGLRRRSK